jgi:lysine 2,3-aminomutase
MNKKQPQIGELIKQNPALARQFFYSSEEEAERGEDDPLQEENFTPVKGLVHKYTHEVLVLLTSNCARYCRFCTRRRKTFSEKKEIQEDDLKKMAEYIKSQPEVYEVIISGGDPLIRPILLEKALKLFSRLPQIKVIRVGTRLHFSDPEAINSKVLNALKMVKKQPLYIMAHFEHPVELTKKTREAIKKLQKVATMILSQTVSLRGVNDKVEVLEELFVKLTQIGVKPYYFLRCDPVKGAEHFVVDFKKEIEIFTELRRRLNGIACPLYVIDTPGGFGKVPGPLDFWDFVPDYYYDFKGKRIKI